MTENYIRLPAGHIYNENSMTNLHESMCNSLAYDHSNMMDLVTSVDVQKHNVIATATSMEWDFDLRDLWLTEARWTTMIRQYINPIALTTWLDTIEAKLKGRKRGVSIMRTNEVEQRSSPNARNGTRIWRAWGSCMLAIGYRALPKPQLTLHSRTSYLGYIGALDMSVAYVCAKLIAERVGLVPEDIQFVWHLEAAQFHAFKSLAYLLDDPIAREEFMAINVTDPNDVNYREFRRRQPGLFICRKWMNIFERDDREGTLYSEMKFGQTRRIRKRYHTEVLGYDYGEPFEGGSHINKSQNGRFKPLPNRYAKDLTFDKLFSSAAHRSTRVSWEEYLACKVDTTDESTDDYAAE